MASSFPGAIDSFTDPLSGSALNSPSHSAQHADLNDAAEKIETYMGFVKVIPTSATNGTVGATGTVTVGNAVASVAVNGAFSSLYDNYLITYHGGASSAQGPLGLQLGSTTTGYYGNMIYGTHGSTAVLAVSDNNAARFTHIGGANGDMTSLNVTLLNPFAAAKTVATGVGTVYTTINGAYNGWLNNTTSYTAFTVIPGSGTLTGGTITVYGYRK